MPLPTSCKVYFIFQICTKWVDATHMSSALACLREPHPRTAGVAWHYAPTRFSWKGICLYLLEFVGTVKYLLVFVGMFNYLLVFVWIIGIFEVFVSICWYLFKFSRYFFVSICICLHFQCICWYVFVVTGTSNVFVCIC